MTLTEKSAYLKGLAEGIKLSDDDNGKVLKAIIDIIDDITNELADVADGVDELCEQIDAVDEDLANLEMDLPLLEIQKKIGKIKHDIIDYYITLVEL